MLYFTIEKTNVASEKEKKKAYNDAKVRLECWLLHAMARNLQMKEALSVL